MASGRYQRSLELEPAFLKVISRESSTHCQCSSALEGVQYPSTTFRRCIIKGLVLRWHVLAGNHLTFAFFFFSITASQQWELKHTDTDINKLDAFHNKGSLTHWWKFQTLYRFICLGVECPIFTYFNVTECDNFVRYNSMRFCFSQVPLMSNICVKW